MTVIVDKNMVIKGTGKTTVSSPYLPTEGLLFTYLPNYTNIDSYNIGNRNPSTSTVYTDPTNTSTQYEGIISGKYNLLYEAGGTLPTLKISNNNTLYSMNGDQNTSYFISFWVYFDEFPNSSTGIKRKRTFLLGLDFGINSSISIGVTAPFYLTQSGSEYKYQFSPISFCSIISTPIDSTTGGNRTVSFSTDYKFYKGQWYFITLKLRPNGSQNINQSGDWIVSMYINNNLENTSIYEGNMIMNRGKNQGPLKGWKHSARKQGTVSSSPGFKNRYGTTISNSSYQEYTFNQWIDIENLKSITFSPCQSTVGFRYNRSTNHVKFGQIYIYTGNHDTKLYDDRRY